jgi:hypothetical protein
VAVAWLGFTVIIKYAMLAVWWVRGLLVIKVKCVDLDLKRQARLLIFQLPCLCHCDALKRLYSLLKGA